METLILPEILQKISKYLSISQTTKMKHSCKSINANLKIFLKQFDKILIKKINDASGSSIGSKLLDVIKKHNDKIYVSGSIIHQCIFNKTYKDSDIDIYIQLNEKYHTYSTNAVNEIINVIDTTSLSRSKFIFTRSDELNGWYEDYKNSNGKVIIQLLLVNNIKDHIVDNYDFTFNRNYYNGFNVFSENKNDLLNKKGLVQDWDKMFNYIKNCDKHATALRILSRAKKFKSRGFDILNYHG